MFKKLLISAIILTSHPVHAMLKRSADFVVGLSKNLKLRNVQYFCSKNNPKENSGIFIRRQDFVDLNKIQEEIRNLKSTLKAENQRLFELKFLNESNMKKPLMDINPIIPSNLKNDLAKQTFKSLIKFTLMNGHLLFNKYIHEGYLLTDTLNNALIEYYQLIEEYLAKDKTKKDFNETITILNNDIDKVLLIFVKRY